MTSVDVVIVGAGPAGLAAAIELRQAGLSVLLADEQPAPGGQVWRGAERNAGTPLAQALGADYERGGDLIRRFRDSGAEYCPETQVWQIEDGWKVFLTHNGAARRVAARAVLLATGAQERPVPFAGWTLPGVMTVGAAQILLKSGGYLPEGPVWIAGAGPLPLLYAAQLDRLGGRIAGFLDTSTPANLTRAARHLPAALRDWRALSKGLAWRRALGRNGSRLVRGASGLSAEGDGQLARIGWTAGGQRDSAEAGLLLIHEGVVPGIHITRALGCAHDWSAAQHCLAPRLDRWGETSCEGLFVAGDGGGIGGMAAAEVSGRIAALGIARQLDAPLNAEERRRSEGLDGALTRALAARPFLDALFPPPVPVLADDVVVCRCEEVTAGAIRAAAKVGAPDSNRVKAATRVGMGPCQGRQCGYTVAGLIAETHGLAADKVDFFNIRPPLKPVTLGELASLGGSNVE